MLKCPPCFHNYHCYSYAQQIPEINYLDRRFFDESLKARFYLHHKSLSASSQFHAGHFFYLWDSSFENGHDGQICHHFSKKKYIFLMSQFNAFPDSGRDENHISQTFLLIQYIQFSNLLETVMEYGISAIIIYFSVICKTTVFCFKQMVHKK